MARGDDASTLKVLVIGWVQEMFGVSVPVLVPNSKAGRGLYNDHTGRLLCPIEFDWENEEYVLQ